VRRVAIVLVIVAGALAIPVAHSQAALPQAALPQAALPQAASSQSSPAHCGALDLPETGIQGDVPRADDITGRAMEGYNCGVALVGHNDLGGRGANANMAWAGNCAYVAGAGNGIAVLDVSDPRHPQQTTTLHGGGSDFTLETLNAISVGSRAVLVAGRYGPAPAPVPAPMDIYDVSDCAHPKLVTTFMFPENIHNLTFSPDGTRVYATLPLQVLDITDLAHPVFLGKLDDQIPAPTGDVKYLAHEVWTSDDGNTLYLGGQTPTFSYFTIVDITGWPAKAPTVLSQVEGRGHSIRLATINGRKYVLHSEESIVDPVAKGCVPEDLNPFAGIAQPWLSDVTDPRHPIMRVSQFRLAINDPSNCPTEIADGVNASVHYHDVDDPDHTTFAMLSMWNAGLRVVDLRDPLHPTEVGYFNPGAFTSAAGGVTLDQAWGHIHYDTKTGYIWFATETGGFWVVELEPQVRAALGLPTRSAVSPQGGPARPGDSVSAIAPVGIDAAKYYCTLSSTQTLN
jgi:hypothetical protein